MSTLSVRIVAASRPRVDAAVLVRRLSGPVAGLLAALIAVTGSGTPSYWGDEGASVLSAERSWPSLLRELGQIDSVHGLYYAFLHVWIRIAGADEWSTRLPSAIAAGLAVWGVVSLGRRLFGLRVGLIAGGVLAIIPEFTRIGIEARSYAMAVALGVWLTVLLVRLTVRGGSRAGWALYALGAVTAVALFEFLAMLVAVHVVLLWALRVPRRTWRRWLIALAAAGLPVAALLLLSWTERHQIGFLAHHDYGTLHDVLVAQWFRTDALAVLVWALLIAGIGLGMRRIRSQRRRVAALVVWALGPTLALVAVNVAVMPIYNQRYLSPSLPAVALLAALGVDGILRLLRSRRRIRIVVAAALALALLGIATPSYLAQRRPFSKDGGADLRQTADTLHRLARPGDAVVFTRAVSNSQRPQMETRLYPQDFARLDDVALKTPYWRRSGIWDAELPVSELGSRLADHPVVWADEVRGAQSADLAALASLGYRVTRVVPIHRSVLYRLERETP